MSERVRCPTCDTEQSAASARATERCSVCGAFLFGREEAPERETTHRDQPTGDASPTTPPSPRPWTPPEARRIEMEDPAELSASLSEIEEGESRLTWLHAMVPFWGVVAVLRRSRVEPGRPLGQLAVASLSTAAVLAIPWLVLVASRPDPEDVRRRTEERLRTVASLVRSYRADVGELPSRETWERSASRGDPRFLDAWGRPFVYRPEDGGFVVGTLGADGVTGGNGVDTDVFLTFPEGPDSAGA